MRGIIAGMPAIPAIPLSQARPGDIVLCHEQGFLAKALRFGQRLRVPWMYAEWNHCAVLNARGDSWLVYEAEAGGVTEQSLASVGEYVIVSADSFPAIYGTVDRGRIVAFARRAIGAKYGFLTILCIIVNLMTPRGFSFRRPGTLICSALVMRALEHGGALSPCDPFQVTPAEIAQLAATGKVPSLVVT